MKIAASRNFAFSNLQIEKKIPWIAIKMFAVNGIFVGLMKFTLWFTLLNAEMTIDNWRNTKTVIFFVFQYVYLCVIHMNMISASIIYDWKKYCSVTRILSNSYWFIPSDEESKRKKMPTKLKLTQRVNVKLTSWTWYHHCCNEYYILPLSYSHANSYSVFKDFSHFSRIDKNVMRTKRNPI